MFRKTKWVVMILAIIFAMTVFASCNNTSQPSTETTKPMDDATEAPANTDEEGVPEASMVIDPSDVVDLEFLWPLANPPQLEGSKIGEAIKEQTGVNLSVIATMGDWAEYHSVMLASGDFHDVVTVAKGAELARYVEAEALIDIEELAKENAPTFLSILESDSTGNSAAIYREMGDGVLRFWGMDNSINRPGQSPVVDFYDKDNFPVEEGGPSYALFVHFPTVGDLTDKKATNIEETYELYKTYMDQMGGDGVHYAVTMNRDEGKGLVEMANAMAGYQTIDHAISKRPEESYTDAKYFFMEPPVLPFMKFLNKLYTEGMMDPEGPLQIEEDEIAKLVSGKSFSTLGGWHPSFQATKTFYGIEGKEDNIFIPMVLNNEGEQFWNMNTASIGWRMVGITPSCKRPDKVMQLIEWAFTDTEASLLLGYGFEGEDYIWNDEGEPDINAEIDATHNGDYYYELGFSNGGQVPWNWAFWPTVGRTVDGYPPNVTQCAYKRNPDEGTDPAMSAVNASPFNYLYDTFGTYFAEYGYIGITIGADDPKNIAKGTADNLINDAVANMVIAGSEQEVEQIYNETVQKMVDAGIEEYISYMNEIAASR